MKKHILLFAIFLMVAYCAQAQYMTITPGPWNVGSTWNLGNVPTSLSGTITVNHAVTIPSGYSVSIDQTTVNSSITINAGGQLTIADGTGVDLTMMAGSALLVNGELIRNNLSTLNQDNASSASFGAASIYRHRYQTTEGAPPLASWNATSNFFMEGFANTSTLDLTSSAWNQSFGNFTYNCISQRSIVSFNGLVTSIQGNLSFLSTGTNLTRLTDNEVNVTITIGGNFSISGNSRVNFSEDGTGGIINLAGNFNYTSVSSLGSYLTNTGSTTLNITGDFIMSAGNGRIYMAGPGGSTGTSTINLSKNFTLTSGFITESGTGAANGNLRFIGNGNFTFVNSGSIINIIHYFIASTVTLDLSIYPIVSGANSTLTLNGTLICGSLEATGAIRNSTALGNIRTPNALRVYNSGSVIIYRSSSAQFMGDGQPSITGVTTIIDNNQGVTLYQGTVTALTINGNLQMQSGSLFIGTRTLNLNGTISYTTGTLGGNSSSVLVIGGTSGGSFGTLRFDPSNNTLGTLTLNRTGAAGGVSVNSTLIVSNQLNLTNGTLTNTSGLTTGNGCIVTRYPTGVLAVNRLSHTVGQSYNLYYRTASTLGNSLTFTTGLEMPSIADNTALNDFTIFTGQVADILQLTQNVTINGNVFLNRGSLQPLGFNLTMRGSTWSDNSGNFAPGTGSVIFSGATTISGTSTPLLGNIQLTTGNSLALGKNVSISGNIDFQASSTFTASTFAVTLNGSSLQTISASGNDFFSITVAKSAGNVQLTSALDLTSILRFNSPSANCNFQANGFLTLISTSDAAGDVTTPGTGQIYRLSSNNTVTGDVIVQRYMSGEGRIYRYLSSPVTNASLASWKDDFAITGTFNDHSSGTVCGLVLKPNTPSLFYYNETFAGAESSGYVAYPSSGTAASNSLVVGRGYAAFVRECTNPTVVDVTGPINQGLVTFNVTYTNTGNVAADGYNLIGNPYPCTVDWDFGWTKTRISPVISMTDNGNGGIVRYWDGAAGAITNGQIAPGQAFFVRATGLNPVLRIGENAKAIAPIQSAEFVRVASDSVPQPTSSLSIALNNGHFTDQTFFKIRPESIKALDDWDAPKLDNEIFDLSINVDGVPMAIHATNEIESTIHLNIKDVNMGDYTLTLNEQVGEFSTYEYVIIDHYLNRQESFSKPYKFTVNGDAASARQDRFIVQLVAKDLETDATFVYPNPVDRYLHINSNEVLLDRISIFDNLGAGKPVKAHHEESSTVVDLEGFASGIYYLDFINKGAKKVVKVIKK